MAYGRSWPKPGDRVKWSRTGTEWIVVAEGDAPRSVVLRGILLDVVEEFTAAIAELEPVYEKPVYDHQLDEDFIERPETKPAPRRLIRKKPGLEKPEPKDERDRVERMVDRILFSPEVLTLYHREYAPPGYSRGRASQHMRWVLRKHGVLKRPNPREYIRVRLRGRFDAVIATRPASDEEPVMVTELVDLRHARQAKRKAA